MKSLDLDDRLIRATASHGYGICVDIKPEHEMEKVLFAADELTGLIGASCRYETVEERRRPRGEFGKEEV